MDWYIARAGVSYGPFTAEEFARFQAEGQLTPTDHVRKAGIEHWIPYEEFHSRSLEPRPGASTRKCAICLIARGLARVPYETLSTVLELMRRPSEFGRQRIDVGARDLQRALYFYLNLFGVSFFIYASFSKLSFYDGESHPRELVALALQIGLALPILYGLNFVCRQRVRMTGLVQGVLYVDGVYLVVLALFHVALAYLSFRGAIDRGELDIVGTELEHCLSKSSYVYWLIRGDLQFFNYQPGSTAALVDDVREYAPYALIVPFGVIFAKLMKTRYGASLKLNALFALLTYVVVFHAVYGTLERVRSSIAWKTPCVEPAMQQAYSTYNQGLVLRQIGERINAELQKSPAGRTVSIDGNRFVMDTKLRPEELPGHAYWHLLEIRGLYCGNTNFKLARAIQVPLKLIVRNASGEVLREDQFTQSGCAQM